MMSKEVERRGEESSVVAPCGRRSGQAMAVIGAHC